jgi:N-acyl homoserine lactone hydrolase
VLTHAHWDHASGLADFPGVPVLLPAAERRFVDEGGFVTAVARSITAPRWEEYAFADGPYLEFPASHDLHGDGSIVIVPAPGHTPGSVIVFVTLPDDDRYAFIGDLAWQREGVTLREERAWLFRIFADDDPAGVREQLLRMHAIGERFPDLTIVPAHDARAFAELPQLSRR